MAWSHEETKAEVPTKKIYTTEELLKTERHWVSNYNDPNRWITDFKEVHYTLIGEYEVDKAHKLYRFELEETRREELSLFTAHFQNVLIDISLGQPKLGNDFTEKEGKPAEVKAASCETCKRPFDKEKKYAT